MKLGISLACFREFLFGTEGISSPFDRLLSLICLSLVAGISPAFKVGTPLIFGEDLPLLEGIYTQTHLNIR